MRDKTLKTSAWEAIMFLQLVMIHVAERNDSTLSKRQVSSSVHGPGCTLNPPFSNKVVVCFHLSDGGFVVILFLLLVIAPVPLQGFLIP